MRLATAVALADDEEIATVDAEAVVALGEGLGLGIGLGPAFPPTTAPPVFTEVVAVMGNRSSSPPPAAAHAISRRVRVIFVAIACPTAELPRSPSAAWQC